MKRQSVFNKRRILFAVGLALILLAASATWALAQTDGVIYACVMKNGTMRIVSDPAECMKNETLLSWNILGPKGDPGLACWDLDGDGIQDLEEDINLDGVWDAADCKGPPGTGPIQGPPGSSGLACWDLNGNGIQDLEEDINLDGVWDAADCKGPQGETGPTGAEGAQGPQGEIGPMGPTGPVANRQLVPEANSFTNLDSAGDVGTSITIGADGLPVISYYDATNLDLKVAHCSDLACSSAALKALDSAGYVGYYTSITIGADGLPVISYLDWANGDLKTAHCANAFCTPYFRRR